MREYYLLIRKNELNTKNGLLSLEYFGKQRIEFPVFGDATSGAHSRGLVFYRNIPQLSTEDSKNHLLVKVSVESFDGIPHTIDIEHDKDIFVSFSRLEKANLSKDYKPLEFNVQAQVLPNMEITKSDVMRNIENEISQKLDAESKTVGATVKKKVETVKKLIMSNPQEKAEKLYKERQKHMIVIVCDVYAKHQGTLNAREKVAEIDEKLKAMGFETGAEKFRREFDERNKEAIQHSEEILKPKTQSTYEWKRGSIKR